MGALIRSWQGVGQARQCSKSSSSSLNVKLTVDVELSSSAGRGTEPREPETRRRIDIVRRNAVVIDAMPVPELALPTAGFQNISPRKRS